MELVSGKVSVKLCKKKKINNWKNRNKIGNITKMIADKEE